MKRIVIKARDGSVEEFRNSSIRYEGGFVIITDNGGNETAISNSIIHRVRAIVEE